MKVLTRELDQTKTKKDFKKVLWIYDFWGYLTERKAMKKVLEISGISDNSQILEVACGTGILLKNIVEQNQNGENIGMDLSPAMLEKTSKRLSGLKSGNYTLKEGDAQHLEFSANSFDYLFNNYMVDLMPVETFDAIASEFYRVLKPNGVLTMATFSFGTKQIHRFWYRLAKNFPDLLTGCRPVSFEPYLTHAGFIVAEVLEISQNSFPSQIIKARKP